MMTVPPQLTSSLPSFSYPASFRHPPPASSFQSFLVATPQWTDRSDSFACRCLYMSLINLSFGQEWSCAVWRSWRGPRCACSCGAALVLVRNREIMQPNLDDQLSLDQRLAQSHSHVSVNLIMSYCVKIISWGNSVKAGASCSCTCDGRRHWRPMGKASLVPWTDVS